MDKAMKDALIERPAAVVVKELELEWEDDGCHCWRADTPFGPYMIRKWGHPRIDYGWWPAFDDGAEAEDVGSHEVAKAACQADYTRRILSAVNAVSEAQVLADERERLAKRAAKLPALVASDDPSRSFDVAQWLRAQEGRK